MLHTSDRRRQLRVVLLLFGLFFLVLAIGYYVGFIGFALILLGASGLRDTRWQVGIIFACLGMAAAWGGYHVGKQRALTDSRVSAGQVSAPADTTRGWVPVGALDSGSRGISPNNVSLS